jgi:hypothetical protein
LIVCFIKCVNSIIFAALISYSSEAFPTVVRAIGYGFTLTFGRMTTFMAPFFAREVNELFPTRNALCLLAPFALLGFWFCRYMPDSNIGQNIIEEEE